MQLLTVKIKLLRSGKSQRQLAQQVGIAESRLSSLLRGWATPKESEKHALALALETTKSELFEELRTAS